MSERGKTSMGTWIVRLLIVVALGGGAWLYLRPSEEKAARQGPPTEQVSRRNIEVLAEASGALEPLRWVEVKSLASGEVIEVNHETGDVVKQGALLAKIDPRDVENAFQQAAAELEAATVRASITQAQKERLEALRKSDVVTEQEYETAIEAAATAKAALVRAQTNRQLAQERRRDAVIRAPIDGTLIERHAEPGQIIASATSNVSGGTVLFKMADLGVMQVRAKVDETDIGTIRPEQKVSVKVEAYAGRTFHGVVHKIEPQSVIEQNVTMFPVLVRLDNKEGLLRPGMNAEVSILIDRRDQALAVPNGAVVSLREARKIADALGVSPEQMEAVMQRPEKQRPSEVTAVEVAQGDDVKAAVAPAAGKEDGSGSAPTTGSGLEPRPGVLFVKVGAGVEPRRVLLGLGDWDYTEVVSGLSERDEVVVVTLAQMEQDNAKLKERIRSRSGIPGAKSTKSGKGG